MNARTHVETKSVTLAKILENLKLSAVSKKSYLHELGGMVTISNHTGHRMHDLVHDLLHSSSRLCRDRIIVRFVQGSLVPADV